jgi:ABC-2 type transport system permease protein
MTGLAKLTIVESKLFLREPGAWIFSVLLPTFILVILGVVLAPHTPSEYLGGQRFLDVFVPSLIVITLATLCVNLLPARLVAYREKGVLRRLSTTPVNPALLLIAQFIINIVAAVLAVVLLMVVGTLGFHIPLPRQPLGFLVAFLVFLVGMSSLFAFGLLVAAVAPTPRVGAALIVPLFIFVMFVGGVYVPRVFLPEVVIRIGEYTPPGVQALLDAWTGAPPPLLPLAIMALLAIIAGMAAVRLFRWE